MNEPVIKNVFSPIIVMLFLVLIVRQVGLESTKYSDFFVFTTIGEVVELRHGSVVIYQPIITSKENKFLNRTDVTFFYKKTPEVKKLELPKIPETDFKLVLSGATSSLKKPNDYRKEVNASLGDVKIGSKIIITGTRTNLLGYPILEKIVILPETFTLMNQTAQANK